MRPGEARFLKWSDVTFRDDLASLILRKTKNGKQRVVMLNKAASQAIVSLKRIADSEYLFPGSGKSGKPFDFDRPFHRAVQKAVLNRPGVEPLVPYHLRHYAISMMGRSGADLRLGMDFAGHSTIKAHERYRHLYETDRMKAAERLQSFVMPTGFVKDPVKNPLSEESSDLKESSEPTATQEVESHGRYRTRTCDPYHVKILGAVFQRSHNLLGSIEKRPFPFLGQRVRRNFSFPLSPSKAGVFQVTSVNFGGVWHNFGTVESECGVGTPFDCYLPDSHTARNFWDWGGHAQTSKPPKSTLALRLFTTMTLKNFA